MRKNRVKYVIIIRNNSKNQVSKDVIAVILFANKSFLTF